jgi:hypothetical protein
MAWFDRVGHGVLGVALVLVVGYIACQYALRRRNKKPDSKPGLAGKGAAANAGIPCLEAAKLAAEE